MVLSLVNSYPSFSAVQYDYALFVRNLSLTFCRDSRRTLGWVDAVMAAPLKDHLDVHSSNTLDPRELYIGQIFYPERFSVSVILKALNVSTCLY